MATSRRTVMQALGVSAAALASRPVPAALAQQSQPLPLDFGSPSSAENKLNVVSCARLEDEARKVLSAGRMAIMGWQADGWTYHENLRALDEQPIAPRRLQNLKEATIDLRTSILGHALPLPMITCPMGAHKDFHVQGELATARGTGIAGTLYVSSGASNCTLEEIAGATPGPKWFQIYMNSDMQINRWLVQRARAAGYSAIVLTADALGAGQSDDYIALGRPRDPHLTFGNHDPARGGRGDFRDQKRDLSFDDIGFLRNASGLPVITKGVVAPADIRDALSAGASAIWVSNHGGRQMDCVPASFTMLRTAVDTVAGRVPVIFDSGIRRGTDVFKSLAMGATLVAVGRPVLWGLICGGGQGVASVYAQLASELHNTLLLAGVAKVTALTRDNIVMSRV